MLTRHCIKIASSSTRSLLFKKFLIREKRLFTPTLCQCNTNCSRSFATSHLAKVSHTTNELHISSGPLQKVNTNTKISSSITSEELLEKLVANLSSDIHQKNRVYKNDFIRVLAKVKELNFSSKKQGLLLIQCCTELLPDETPASRMNLVEEVWSTIKPHTKFTVDHFNELLRVYIANKRGLKVDLFLQQMAPVTPNITTYELILRALGEVGDVNQATEVISNMKAQNFPATESIFNSLIICQGKAGKLQNVQEVLTMMKSLKFESSINTYTAVAKGLAWNRKEDLLLQEMEKARQSGLEFQETHIMEIVKTLAAIGKYDPIPKVLRYLPKETMNSPSISPYMQSVCTLLVFQNHPMPALEIYKSLPLPAFGPKDDQGLHGRSLVRDCVKASIPSSIIGHVTHELMTSGRNPIALQNAAEAALQQAKVPLALDLFGRMKLQGMPLRPHYFWPILIHTSKTYGEKGIMNTLSTMIQLEVKPDYDTIMQYILPFVSFTSAQNLMKKFQDAGVSVTSVLTPMMETLLQTGQVRAASEICELFKGKVDVEKILKPLVKGYLTSMDVKSTVHILEDATEKALDKNKDWAGRFLCVLMKHKKIQDDLTDVVNIVKELAKTPTRISNAAADFCISNLPNTFGENTIHAFREDIIAITDERLVDEAEIFAQHIPHPKQMDEESLKAHLNELEAKGMNTRGVLRRLLQQYCRDGNLAAAREIVQKCEKEGVFLSAGMKAAIFDLHVKSGELELAEASLAELNKSSPNFTLDEYKIIDFATLMVYRKKIERAFDLINEQSKKRRIVGGRNISMNCWRLLDATATHGTPAQTRRMFELLTSLRYCRPSNSLLGPLVRVHLKQDNLQEAVNEFCNLAQKYSKTPLKHELLCQILKSMSDGQTEENFIVNEKSNGRLNKLAHTVLSVDKRIHGAGDVQLTLISALAEVGYKKTLRKLFLDPSVRFHPDALMRRCERFADEKKIAALETVAECGKDLRRFDVEEIYDMMLGIYQREDDCKGAMKLWEKMQEADITPSQKFIRNLCMLLKANNRPLPAQLEILLDKQAKVTQ